MGAVIKNLYEAKTELSALVDRCARGEEFIIAKNGVPMARLVPLPRRRGRRKPGGWEGKVWIADDFNEPLPDEILKEIEEGSLEPPA
jgi:prevent-host-death family protein